LTIPCSYNNGSVDISVTPPNPPVATAATGISQTAFNANWSASSGATGYYLDVSESNTFSNFVEGYENKNVGNVTTSTVNGLSGGTSYYYRLRAYNSGGASGNSNVIAVTTIVNTPPAPEATAATSVTQTGFTANWDASADATGYYLDVSTSSTFAGFVTGYNNKNVGNVFLAEVSGLTAGTTYYYRVRASNAGGTSGNSNTISVKTYLNAPTIPVATAATGINQTAFTANWNAASGATGYFLDVSTSNTFEDFISDFGNKDVGNVTTLPVPGLEPGTVYYYRLRAYHGEGTSGNSNIIQVTTLVDKPLAPVATAATSITTSGFNANWEAVTGASKYFLDVSTGNDFASFVTGYNNKDVGNVVTAPVTGLTAGTVYYFRLRAYNAGGTSENSNTVDVTTILTAPLAPVATSATSITQSGFNANWNAASGATGYYLDVSTSNTFGSFVPGYNNKDIGNTITLKVTGLSAGTPYFYRVRAYNDVGTSGNSNVIQVTTTISIPGIPMANAATAITQTGFNANWNAAANATGYILDVSLTNTFDELLTDYGNRDVGNVNTFPVTGLEPATNYYYRVSAYNSGGTSNYSNIINATTLVTAISDQAFDEIRVNLYPNPTTGKVKIELENSFREMTVSVISVMGSEVLSKEYFATREAMIDLSGSVPGVYFVKLTIGEAVIVRKIILDKQE
jgi:phosphodiesterase/alkaline phosphatase D-like protein